MKRFLGIVFGSCLGFILAVGATIAILAGVVAGMGDEEKPEVKNNSVLLLNFSQPVVDHVTSEFSFGGETPVGLDRILAAINDAKANESIKGIFLDLSSGIPGTATTEEIRNAVIDFKKSGKFVIAYSDYYSQASYYLATAADNVYANPSGGVDFKGYNYEFISIKGVLNKIGVEPQIIRHGKFKSAIEPLINDKMSPENREQVKGFTGSLWGHYLEGVAKARKTTVENLQGLANNLTVTNAKSALENKLIDGLKYKDEVLEIIKGKTEAKSIDKINFIGAGKYAKTVEPKGEGKEIAVIFAEGDIVDGPGDGNIGSTTMSKLIRKARLDDDVAAIVLRVNSPGGSALASEVIWREVNLAKTENKKTVIVSMGNVAASGGYYIACAADAIVAQPNTITGSIGVFGVLWNASALNKTLGVATDTVKTATYSDIGTASRPMTDFERNKIQLEIEEIYDLFISRVAAGRKLTKAQVDSIGQGRVWSGIDAKRIGLVDEFGGLNTAIELAAKKANLTEYKLKYLPYTEKGFNAIKKALKGDKDEEVKALVNSLGIDPKYLEYLRKARNIKGTQARLPFELEYN